MVNFQSSGDIASLEYRFRLGGLAAWVSQTSLFACVLSLVLASSCVNSRSNARSNRAYLNYSNVTLTQISRSSANPNTQIDLSGDGSGKLGAKCASGGQGQGDGASNCTCAFRYRIGNEEITATSDTTRYERDLIRCEYSMLPKSLAQVQVSVHYVSDDTYSNEATFNLLTGVGFGVNPAIESTFLPVIRYQCTDIVTIVHGGFWNSIYDRDQSEDPRTTTPLNFYTTNLGQSITLHVGGFRGQKPASNQGWECPSHPLDPRIQYEPTTAAQHLTAVLGPDYANPTQPLLAKYDMRVFSESGSGEDMVYPPQGAPAQIGQNFFAARTATAVFQAPIHAYVAPNVLTDPTGQTGPTPIGYAAYSIPTGPEQEACPLTRDKDSINGIPIPEGYRFAKLWLFAADLPARQFVTSSKLSGWSHFYPLINTVRSLTQQSCASNVNGFVSRVWNTSVNTQASTYSCSGMDPTYGIVAGATASGNSEVQNVTFSDDQNGGRRDYLYVVTPEDIHSRDMGANASSAGAKYIPRRFLSALDCRVDANWKNALQTGTLAERTAKGCLPGRSVAYASVQEIGANPYQAAALDSRLGFKFPLCVLVKSGGGS